MAPVEFNFKQKGSDSVALRLLPTSLFESERTAKWMICVRALLVFITSLQAHSFHSYSAFCYILRRLWFH